MGIVKIRQENVVAIIWAFSTLFSSIEVYAKSRHPITENEIHQRKNQCYADIESGLWGQQCRSSKVDKENCALRCVSPVCYGLIYESDPLEEGEKDYIRSQEYKYCMHKFFLLKHLMNVKAGNSIGPEEEYSTVYSLPLLTYTW